MDIQESLGLLRRFESTHAPLSHPGWLMGRFGTVIGIPGRVVDRIRDQLSVCNTVRPHESLGDISPMEFLNDRGHAEFSSYGWT